MKIIQAILLALLMLQVCEVNAQRCKPCKHEKVYCKECHKQARAVYHRDLTPDSVDPNSRAPQ